MKTFDEMFNKYYSYVVVIVFNKLKYINEDIIINVFYKLSKQSQQLLNNENKLKAWLIKTSNNACIDHIRSLKRLNRNKQNYKDSFYNEPNTEDDEKEIERVELESFVLQFIYDEINKLSPSCKRIFTLYYINDINGYEIANIMGISTKTVYVQLQKARQMLRLNILFNKKAAPMLAQQLLFKPGEK